MARDSYNEEERRYANNRLAEIARQEQEERTEYLGRQVKLNDTIRNYMNQGEGDFESFFEDYAKKMVINKNNYNLTVRLYNIRTIYILKNFKV